MRKMNYKNKNCLDCDISFKPKSSINVYCDDCYKERCKKICEFCGAVFYKPAPSAPRKSCGSKECVVKAREKSHFKHTGFKQPLSNPDIRKKRATYEKEREEAIQKINETSPVGKAITNFIAALKKAGLKEEMLPDFRMLWNDNCLTDAEKAAIKEVHTAYHLAMSKMLEKCRECVAILVNCETFEQKMTVLQKYDIIDSDYKLKA